ncbi:hypothetical protein PSACC_03245 [Paramicrosporidium saccamoebae]|uniref:SPRY domain-containing protein n=1 Tax=Paramicrosporidium saccamoebae TaxID=1246581 RepID=A0A2H9TGU1_9FUNG|nr:hypothetical protein PSACC_03245 [Paramicrosporidium saccamoebae]
MHQSHGFRYCAAEPVPWIHGRYRRARTNGVTLSQTDKAQDVTVDGCAAFGGRLGYRSVLASEGAVSGDLYFELQWNGPDGSNVRFGVIRIGATMLGPVGVDEFGYAWCSNGDRYHMGKRETFSAPFEQDDILGCCIRLPSISSTEEAMILSGHENQRLISCRGLYFQETISREAPTSGGLTTLHSRGSIEFFKNGVSMGVAFSDLPGGVYYPAFSLYRDAKVYVNFGPEFIYPSPPNSLPFCDICQKNEIGRELSSLKDFLLSR